MTVLLRPSLRALFCALLVVSALPAWAEVGRDEAAAVAQRVASGPVLAVERPMPAAMPPCGA